MNMHPTSMTETGESLARLAEIADAVSRQQQAAAIARSVQSIPRPNPFGAVSAALRKRALESHLNVNDAAALSAKRAKNDEPPPNGVRFREYQAEIWSEKFEDLCEFRKYYGHCHVPHTYVRNAPLAQWVKRQRYQYKLKVEEKRSTLSDERVRLLNKIGFIWNSHDAVWEERWNELLQYKRNQGHCIVPSNYAQNPQLAVWVKRQRRQYKFYKEKTATSMTPERIAKLEKIGFAWDCRKNKDDEETGDVVRPRPASPATKQPASSSEKTDVGPSDVPPNAAKPSTKPQQQQFPRCEFMSFSRFKY